MRRRLSIAAPFLAGFMMMLFSTPRVVALDTQDKGSTAKESRIDGTIQSVDKGTKTVVVRLRGKQDTRQVVYDDKTQFTFRNKAASLDEVKEGRRVICLGTLGDKNRLMATRVDVRDEM